MSEELSKQGGNMDQLFDRVVSILEQARQNVVRSINYNMVIAYWLIGREIVEEVQKGEKRADYCKRVLANLSKMLNGKYGKGFSVSNLKYFRQFFIAFEDRFQIGHNSCDQFEISHNSFNEKGLYPELSWSHYRVLMRVVNIDARDFCEKERRLIENYKAELEE